MAVCDKLSFREEARWQMACAYCDKVGKAFHAHHVVDVQTLTRYGVRGRDLYDTRNALRLCAGIGRDNCHFMFENRAVALATQKLTDDNVEYAFEVLGLWAADFLRRDYDDSIPDQRIRELEFKYEAHAEL